MLGCRAWSARGRVPDELAFFFVPRRDLSTGTKKKHAHAAQALMAALPSYDRLVRACAALDIDTSGDAAALHARLGAALVARLLDVPAPTTPPPTPARSPPGAPERRSGGEKRPLSEAAARWHAFARHERPLVLQAGFTANADVIKEISRRFKLAKRVGTAAQPPMLEAPSEGDSASDSSGVVALLDDVGDGEIASALAAHGLEPTSDADADRAALASVVFI